MKTFLTKFQNRFRTVLANEAKIIFHGCMTDRYNILRIFAWFGHKVREEDSAVSLITKVRDVHSFLLSRAPTENNTILEGWRSKARLHDSAHVKNSLTQKVDKNRRN